MELENNQNQLVKQYDQLIEVANKIALNVEGETHTSKNAISARTSFWFGPPGFSGHFRPGLGFFLVEGQVVRKGPGLVLRFLTGRKRKKA